MQCVWGCPLLEYLVLKALCQYITIGYSIIRQVPVWIYRAFCFLFFEFWVGMVIVVRYCLLGWGSGLFLVSYCFWSSVF